MSVVVMYQNLSVLNHVHRVLFVKPLEVHYIFRNTVNEFRSLIHVPKIENHLGTLILLRLLDSLRIRHLSQEK